MERWVILHQHCYYYYIQYNSYNSNAMCSLKQHVLTSAGHLKFIFVMY
jgi:hypothetical protein